METRPAAIVRLDHALNGVAAKIDSLHKGVVYGAIEGPVPLGPENLRGHLIEELAQVIAACAQAQQHIVAMENVDLPQIKLTAKTR